ncbi:alpha/beta hydrolase [Nocardia puris]|uniref:alpha/beta fold hydrolase n=1 Tax=Nocardia puris TaxID=208602 RepID=UPI001893741A|nr:alpha/beta hydrolase [Nocardia puris]MBF6211656.1 alpha/beta hydrolase [Nocardia puris]MBF6365659.1 alpha/beta hydrolase [Nocardia puris]MBF6460698.1 alpha/beta hydrolase [Nocardia puris]
MPVVASKDGTEIAYDIAGAGPALVYITGATCFRRFRPVVADVDVFAKGFTVYSYDRRGRGDSGDTLPCATEREVEDVEAIIDAAGGSAVLYGHSSGAVLALEAASRFPDKVDGVVIYDASYVHDESERVSYARLAEQVGALLAEGGNAKALKVFLQGIGMPRVFVALLPLMPGWKSMKALAPTLMYDIALTADLPPVERFANLDLPVHVTVGEKSPPGLHDVARQLADALPRATHRMLAGQDHMVSAKELMPILAESVAHR